MKENILRAFTVHTANGVISWFILRPFSPYTDDRMNISIWLYLLFTFILISVLYIWAGTRFRLQPGSRRSWAAAFTVAIPGLVMWISFFFLPGHGDLEWIYFFLYYQSMAPLGELIFVKTNVGQLWFNLIILMLPSILMGIGFQWKWKRENSSAQNR